MMIIDANYILRWFLNDVPPQAEVVDGLFRSADPESLLIDRVTLAEVTYVLRSKEYDHKQIALIFEELYYFPSLAGLNDVDKAAIDLYRDTTLDFEDCVLVAYNKVAEYDVGTFDKELQKLTKS